MAEEINDQNEKYKSLRRILHFFLFMGVKNVNLRIWLRYILLFSILFGVLYIVNDFNENVDEKVVEQLQENVDYLNSLNAFDKKTGVRLDKASLEPDLRFVVQYTFTKYTVEDITEDDIQRMKKEIIENYCSEPGNYKAFASNAVFESIYNDKNGKKIFDVTVSHEDCGF